MEKDIATINALLASHQFVLKALIETHHDKIAISLTLRHALEAYKTHLLTQAIPDSSIDVGVGLIESLLASCEVK